MHAIELTVDGRRVTDAVEARTSLADFLRERCGITGVHQGCEHGVCGACTTIVDGLPVRACLMLAVQADGTAVRTIAGMTTESGELTPLQQSFREAHGLQCGFCTPGMLLTMQSLLDEDPDPDEERIRDYMHGNICRCTGYQQIVEAVRLAAQRGRREAGEGNEQP